MKQDVNDIIRNIAKQEGVSEQEVIDEMQIAIDAAYNSTDPTAQAEWAAMPFVGKPTPQEFILYMTGRISNQQKH